MSNVNSKMTALADEVRELSGATEALSIDEMTTNVGEANDEVDTQMSLIAQLAIELEGKAGGGGSNEDVTTETNEYTEKITQLETAVTALETELAGKASGGSGASKAYYNTIVGDGTELNIALQHNLGVTPTKYLISCDLAAASSFDNLDTEFSFTSLCGTNASGYLLAFMQGRAHKLEYNALAINQPEGLVTANETSFNMFDNQGHNIVLCAGVTYIITLSAENI